MRIRSRVSWQRWNSLKSTVSSIRRTRINGKCSEGTTELFETDYWPVRILSQSGQLYEAGAMALGGFSMGPTFRAKSPDAPAPDGILDDRTWNGLVPWRREWRNPGTIRCLPDSRPDRPLSIGTGNGGQALTVWSHLRNCHIHGLPIRRPLKCCKKSMDVKYGDDFGSPEETYLADQFKNMVFIKNYLKSRPSTCLQPRRWREVICADLLAPKAMVKSLWFRTFIH